MGEVREFPAKPEKWLSGRARCLDCGLEWEASAPVGTVCLECANCKTNRGVLKGPFGAKEGDQEWVCNCGCDVFKILAKNGIFEAIICLRCGQTAEF